MAPEEFSVWLQRVISKVEREWAKRASRRRAKLRRKRRLRK